MPLVKWGQLICAFLLVLLPPAIHYRNLKYNDRRTNTHKRFTHVAIGIWVLTAIFSLVLTGLDTHNSIRQQQEQLDWTTGGHNYPVLQYSTPYIQSNRFVLDLLNPSSSVPLYNVRVVIWHWVSKLPGTDISKTLEKEIKDTVVDKEMGTLHPNSKQRLCVLDLVQSDPRWTEEYLVWIYALNVDMRGSLLCTLENGKWIIHNQLLVHFVRESVDKEHSYILRSCSPNGYDEKNWNFFKPYRTFEAEMMKDLGLKDSKLQL